MGDYTYIEQGSHIAAAKRVVSKIHKCFSSTLVRFALSKYETRSWRKRDIVGEVGIDTNQAYEIAGLRKTEHAN